MERELPPDLSGRRVLVMGASGPVAGAVAFAFAEAGADVALTTMTSDAEEALAVRRLSKAITNLGRQSVAESVDMSIGAGVQVAVRQVSKALGGIDIVVVATDGRQGRATDRLGDADWSRLVNLNLSAAVFACRAAAREMASRTVDEPKGRIILLLPNVEMSAPAAYIATRVAVASLVPALAREWATMPLTVHGINLTSTLDDESQAAEAAYVALKLATPEGDEKNGRVIRAGSFR